MTGEGSRPENRQFRNDLSGNADGPVIQAQNIHGGITFTVPPPPPSGPDSRPDQVPALTVPFVNRTKELQELGLADAGQDGQAGAASGVRLEVLSGMRGIGKTSLACRYADAARDRFPDGQIFIDFAALRGSRTGGDVSTALASALSALGVADSYIPESLEDRVALFRTRSAGRRLLILLDDVDQPAQVRSLVPKGRGSTVLVTSNSGLGELTLDGARPLPLKPLDDEAGLLLLADRCGRQAVEAERPAAQRLVEICAGLPKALHLVAARLLLARGRLSMARLVEELADENRRLRGLSLRGEHSMSAILDLSYRELPSDAARLYRILGWLPGRTFDAGTAAAAASLDLATAEPVLGLLEEASLLDATADGRYRFHDLVRLHAREHAAEEEPASTQRAVVARVTGHYLALTAFADRAVRQDRLRIGELADLVGEAPDPFAAEGGPDPLAWLDAERANILAVLREASRLGLHQQVWPLAEGFTALFLHRRYVREWKESLELGATSAAEAVVPAAEARLRSLLSRPLMDLGDHDRAHGELEAAVACAEVSGHTALSASVYEFFGRYWDRCDPSRAMAAYRRSIELNIEAGEWRGVAIATYFLGCAQDAAGHHRQALETLGRAEQALLERGDERMAARVLAAIGAVHEQLGDTGKAVEILDGAARALRAQRASHYEAQTLVRLADLLERTGGAPDAQRTHLARAVEIHEQGGSPEAEGLRARLQRVSRPEDTDVTGGEGGATGQG
ncbi:NB-ARC domain-containing protein [Streptomyces sp. TP-A0874]|uniref:NB-ARC domain-containing protein n=1 Tax=Streptomyces sp. TP-A0874 TaxID=549819 RepID=UPI000852BAF5|nr:NB-ARC domain-containing protein [Streptomyces sp. TP-A0874]